MGILDICTNILPVILLFFGVLGSLGLVQAGPREVPKTHRYNRLCASSFFPLALGIYLLGSSNQTLYFTGAALALIALFLYGYFYREARKQYPEMSSQEWLEYVSSRYKGSQKPDPSAPAQKPTKGNPRS